MKDENFYVIHGWMINKLKLKGNELLCYAIIYGFSQDGETMFNGSRKYISDCVGASNSTIDNALASLVEKGLIIKEVDNIKGVIFNRYKVSTIIFEKSKCDTLPKITTPHITKNGTPLPKIVNNNIDYNIDCHNIDLKEDKDKSLSKKFSKNLDLSAVQPHMMNVVETWLAYKKEKKKQYTQKGFDAFYKKIVKLSGNNANKAMQIVEESMSNNWDGIFPLRENFTIKDNFEIGMVLSDDREAIYKDMEENGWMHD